MEKHKLLVQLLVIVVQLTFGDVLDKESKVYAESKIQDLITYWKN